MRRRVPRVESRATSWASRFCCQGNSWVTSVLGNAYSGNNNYCKLTAARDRNQREHKSSLTHSFWKFKEETQGRGKTRGRGIEKVGEGAGKGTDERKKEEWVGEGAGRGTDERKKKERVGEEAGWPVEPNARPSVWRWCWADTWPSIQNSQCRSGYLWTGRFISKQFQS